jgi:hypothetical protein
MELALPAFPSEPWPQAAFLAVVVLIVGGLAMLIFPVTAGRLLGLASRETRPGGIGEVRAAGGFLAGFAAAALMFFDQPVLVAGLGVAMGMAAFARVISLMSDTSASLLNLLLLIVQAIFASAMLYYFFDVITPDMQLGVPTESTARLVFFTFSAMSVIGFLILFAPRIAMSAAGLWVTPERPGGIASVRSTGGFLLGLGLFGMAIAGMWESGFVVFLMLCFGVAAALVLSIAGRLAALALNRGNLVFGVIAVIVQVAAAGSIILYVSGAM